MRNQKDKYLAVKLDNYLTRNVWIIGNAKTGKTIMIQDMKSKQTDNDNDTIFIDQNFLLCNEKIMIAHDLYCERVTQCNDNPPVILILDDYMTSPIKSNELIRLRNGQLKTLIESGKKANIFVWGTSQSVLVSHIGLNILSLTNNTAINLINLNDDSSNYL